MYKNWAEFYAPICGNKELLIGNIETHAEFIRILMRHSQPVINEPSYRRGGRILEIGVGTGGLAVPLAMGGREVTCMDIDAEILAMAEKNAKLLYADEYDRRIKYIQRDALNIGYLPTLYDLAYSHGLLEHFDDDKIIDLVEESLHKAPLVFHVVPLIGAMGEQYGDERLMSVTQWWSLFNNPHKGRPWFRHLYIQVMGHLYLPNPALAAIKENMQKMTMYVMAFRAVQKGMDQE